MSASLAKAMELAPLDPAIINVIKDVQDLLIKKTTVPTLAQLSINAMAKHIQEFVGQEYNNDQEDQEDTEVIGSIVQVLETIPSNLRILVLEKMLESSFEFRILNTTNVHTIALINYGSSRELAKKKDYWKATVHSWITSSLIEKVPNDEKSVLAEFVLQNKNKFSANSLLVDLAINSCFQSTSKNVLERFVSLSNDEDKIFALYSLVAFSYNFPEGICFTKIDILKRLLEAGIHPNIVDGAGRSALSYIEERCKPFENREAVLNPSIVDEAVQYLKQHGARSITKYPKV